MSSSASSFSSPCRSVDYIFEGHHCVDQEDRYRWANRNEGVRGPPLWSSFCCALSLVETIPRNGRRTGRWCKNLGPNKCVDPKYPHLVLQCHSLPNVLASTVFWRLLLCQIISALLKKYPGLRSCRGSIAAVAAGVDKKICRHRVTSWLRHIRWYRLGFISIKITPVILLKLMFVDRWVLEIESNLLPLGRA